MTTVVQAIVVPEPEPEPEPELEPKSDGISYPEPTGVHVQPGGGIRATLSELDEYAFDINGYVTIKELLSDDEVAAACGGGAEGLKALAEHPVLLDYVAELVGTGAGSSALPVLLGMPCELPSSTKSDALLGAPGVRAPGKRTPRHRPALEGAGVRAFFVLDDGTPALALLPASHRSAAPAPDAIISEGAADTMLTHPQIFAGDVVLCTSTLLYGMRPKSPADGPAIQRLASCEWVPGTNKHRTMLDVDATLVAPTNETSPFSPSGGGVGHGLMWKPNATRLAELQEIQDEEDEQIRQKAWICVLISLALALATAWLLTQKPTTP